MDVFCFIPVERSEIFVSENLSIPKRENSIFLRSSRTWAGIFCSSLKKSKI